MCKLVVKHYRTIVPTTLSYARSTMVPACASTLTFMKKLSNIARSVMVSRLSEPTQYTKS